MYSIKDSYGDELTIREVDPGMAKVSAGDVLVSGEKAPEVAQALLDFAGSDALVVELPETEFDGRQVRCQGMQRDINNTADIYSREHERTALKMLAIARRVKAERGRLADERQLDKRRDAVLKDIGSSRSYRELSPEGPLQKAVDLILKARDKKGTDA